MRRVVITGMAHTTALGSDFDRTFTHMSQSKNATRLMPEWSDIEGLHTKLGAPIDNFTLPNHYTRKKTRAMGRVAKIACMTTENALIDAGLFGEHDLLEQAQTGVAYGSCSGSTAALCDIARIEIDKKVANISATTFIKLMGHTCAVNIALHFALSGRLIPSSSACTSGSQAIGFAYESIQSGKADIMITGGAEELCPSQVSIFDTLYATSLKHDTPELTPSPFDVNRDGLVIGEGAGTLILEEYEHAKKRNATIYAEVCGFGTNCDASHITQPTANKMKMAMLLALKDAGISAHKIGYINAHGTATPQGDIAESQATFSTFGNSTPISSFKGNFGHTLGACGAIEAALSIQMMHQKFFSHTTNLHTVDPQCKMLDHITESPRKIDTDFIMSNNFAFGGVNTSLIFQKL